MTWRPVALFFSGQLHPAFWMKSRNTLSSTQLGMAVSLREKRTDGENSLITTLPASDHFLPQTTSLELRKNPPHLLSFYS